MTIVRRPGILTGVPSAAVVKAAQEGAMSQSSDLDLADIEAQVGELMATQEQQGEDGVEQGAEDAVFSTAPEEEHPVDKQADEAEEPSPDLVPDTQPATQPAGDDSAPIEPVAEEPAAEESAVAGAAPEERAAEEPPASAPTSGAASKKPVVGLKRKGFAAPRAAAVSVKAPLATPAPAKAAPLLAKKVTKGRPAPPVEATAGEEEEKENVPKQTAPKPAAPKPQMAKPAAPKPQVSKPGAEAPAPKPASAKPAVPKAKPAAKLAAAAVAANTEDGEEAAVKPKRGLNAYMHFVKASREQVKADHPGLDNKELTAKLGEVYRALTAEGKAPFEEAAAADKHRYDAEVAALGPQPAKSKAARLKVAHTKSAYQLFMNEQLPGLKAEHPKAGMPELSRLVSSAWRELAEEEKEPFNLQAKELKAQAREAAARGGTSGADAAATKPAPKKRKPAGGAGPSRKRLKKAAALLAAAAAEGEEGGEEAGAAEARGADEHSDDDDEQERLACDWEANPAEHILAETTSGLYLVSRQGLGFSEYGLVDAATAKAQRLGVAADAPPCPVSLEMVEEFERFKQGIKAELHDNTDAHGELVLESLAPGSVLESCLFLGQLRAKSYPLDRPKKGDTQMKVPLVGTCTMVQRMLMVERARCNKLLEANQALREEVQALQLGGSGANKRKAGAQADADGDSPGSRAKRAAEA